MRVIVAERGRIGAKVRRKEKKEYHSKISANGQITLPKEIRESLDGGPGDVMVFVPTEGGVLIHKKKGLREELEEWRKGLSTETRELIKKTAGWTLDQYHEYFDNLPENGSEMERYYGIK